MKKQIENEQDVKFLVDKFYEQARSNAIIGGFFTQVAKVDWNKHLPKMYGFWNTLLLGKMQYKGNTFVKHAELDEKKALSAEHFNEWIRLWKETVSSNFEGNVADEAIRRAEMLALTMLVKIEHQRKEQVSLAGN